MGAFLHHPPRSAEDVRAFGHFMGEMAILEEKMQAIAETGQSLVNRLMGADSKS